MPVDHVIRAIGFVPNQCATKMCLWWHWTESKTRICTNNTLGQLPFWSFCIECLPEYSQQTSEETRKCSVEYYVENQNLSWNSATKKKKRKQKEESETICKYSNFVTTLSVWNSYLYIAVTLNRNTSYKSKTRGFKSKYLHSLKFRKYMCLWLKCE